MRKINFCLLPLFSFIVFSSCHNYLSVLNPSSNSRASSDDMVSISFAVRDNANQRTAVPVFVPDNYDYMIVYKSSTESAEAVEGAEEKDLFTAKKTYGALGSSLTVPRGWYKFTLKAYPKGSDTVVLAGSNSSVLDLNSDPSAPISFYMKPQTGDGLTGGAVVTFKVTPKELKTDSGEKAVATVKYDWLSDVTFAQALAAEPSNVLTMSTGSDWDNVASDYNTKVLSNTSLAAGISHYIVFKMLAADGTCLARRIESLFIVHGLTSSVDVTVASNQFQKYPVSVDLNKNGQPWTNSDMVIILSDSSGNEYILRDSNTPGVFSGSQVEDGDYNIYIRDIYEEGIGTDTGLNISASTGKITNDSLQIQNSLNFIETNIAPRGVTLTASTPMTAAMPSDNPGKILVVQGSTVSMEFTVDIKNGYQADPASSGVSVGGSVLFDNQNAPVTELDSNPAKPGMQQRYTSTQLQTLSVSGITTVEYTISYVNHTSTGAVPKGEVWVSGIPSDRTYTIEEQAAISLPADTAVSRTDIIDGKQITFTFNGWKNIETTGSTAGQSLSLIPAGSWGNISIEALWKDGVEIDIPETPDPEEPDISGTIFASGYSLIVKWRNNNPATDWTEIYYDYNKDGVINGEDKIVSSTVNFKNFKLQAKNSDGTAPLDDFTFTVLGGQIACIEGPGKNAACTSTINISGTNTVIGNGTTTGVLLGTLTGQRINVDKALSGTYSVTLITDTKYRSGASTNTVATIASPSYAQFNKFRVMFYETSATAVANYNTKYNLTGQDAYTAPCYLPQEITLNEAETEIQLTVSEAIILPSKNEVEWKDDDHIEFQLGEGALISVKCSVFSISVTNGTFKLTQKDMYDGNQVIVTDKLAQFKNGSTITYHEGKTNATDNISLTQKYSYLHMLSQAGDITPQTATEFLKTITFYKNDASTDIKLSVNLQTVPYAEIAAMIDSARKFNKFAYYDGSFYLNVNKAVAWDVAYNEAKQITFNGLNGYLMTITSDVENDYIYSKFGADKSWTGGSRFEPSGGVYDQNTYSIKNTNGCDVWRWQCGPEAGKCYYNKKTYNGSASSIPVDINFTKWNNSEPNNSGNEPCMQFVTNNGGKWNDIGIKVTGSYESKNYVVEFRPYVNTACGTSQVATKQIITLEGDY